MLKIKPLYLIAIVLITAFATWKLSLMSRNPGAHVALLTVKRLDSSLIAANETMHLQNIIMLSYIEAKKKKPEFFYKAAIWSPIMHATIEHTDRIVLQIETLKNRLKKEACLEVFEGKEKYHEDDIDAATRLMITQGEGTTLMDSLKAFSQELMSLLPESFRRQVAPLPVVSLFQQPTENFFKATPAIAAVALLTKFQNDVLRSGNIVADFCGSQVPNSSDAFFRYEPLISQNTTTLLAGETLEIKAGVGAFSTASNPMITIDAKQQTVNDYGFATYKIKVADKDGKIPVSISYTDPNTGLTTTRNTQVAYTVTKQ